jgi:peroxiredoxin Q/BCP
MLGPVVRKGDVVTDFELPDETGAPRRLSGLLADGPVVLFFYPAAMSLGCTVESCHFRDLIGEFKALIASQATSEAISPSVKSSKPRSLKTAICTNHLRPRSKLFAHI